jgi:hypothetical protein
MRCDFDDSFGLVTKDRKRQDFSISIEEMKERCACHGEEYQERQICFSWNDTPLSFPHS